MTTSFVSALPCTQFAGGYLVIVPLATSTLEPFLGLNWEKALAEAKRAEKD